MSLTRSNAGALVPANMAEEVKHALTAANWLRPLADVRELDPGELDAPVSTAGSGADYVAEGGSIPTTDPTFTAANLTPRKLAGVSKFTWELEAQGAKATKVIAESLARSLAMREIRAMLIGNGTTEPQGVLTASAKGADGTMSAVTADNVVDLLLSLPEEHRMAAVFVANAATIKALMSLKTAADVSLWAPPATVGGPDLLLGRPLYSSEDMPDIGAGKKSLLCFDPKGYVIGDVGELEVKPLRETYAETGHRAVAVFRLSDSKLALPGSARHLLHAAE